MKTKKVSFTLTPVLAFTVLAFFILVAVITLLTKKYSDQDSTVASLQSQRNEVITVLQRTAADLAELKETDQVKRNDELEDRIKNIEDTYQSAVSTYESLLKLQEKIDDTGDLTDLFTESLVFLSEQNYASASAVIKDLDQKISAEEAKLTAQIASESIPANTPESNAPPGAGFAKQSVSTDVGSFLVSMVAADLSTTRVIVDTASDSDCGNDCPVLSLGEYVSRNGAFAGINGSYFCPASYPSCAGKTNTFDLLVMNKNKHYFNSDNNVYSNNPAVIFGSGYVRFVSAASQWGRDTGVDGVLSNFPLLVFNSNRAFGGDDDPKKGSRAGRSFVANKGNTVYIGVVHNSTVVEAAYALTALGMENGMNLDSGGSTALWSGGYKVGPGRNLPNAILFVRK